MTVAVVVGEPAPRRRPMEPAEVATELEDGALVDDPDVGDELGGGVTKRWRPHERTEARARQLGVDLRRWPLEEPEPGWESDASCRGVSTEVADQLTECLSQATAGELVDRFCSVCPVLEECFATGRAGRRYGLWGGIVLRGGAVATWRTAKERRTKDALPTAITDTTMPIEETSLIETLPIEETSLIETLPIETTTKRRRGQRVQPRRLTRARRKESRAVASPLD